MIIKVIRAGLAQTLLTLSFVIGIFYIEVDPIMAKDDPGVLDYLPSVLAGLKTASSQPTDVVCDASIVTATFTGGNDSTNLGPAPDYLSPENMIQISTISNGGGSYSPIVTSYSVGEGYNLSVYSHTVDVSQMELSDYEIRHTNVLFNNLIICTQRIVFFWG